MNLKFHGKNKTKNIIDNSTLLHGMCIQKTKFKEQNVEVILAIEMNTGEIRYEKENNWFYLKQRIFGNNDEHSKHN